jgi:hypothetical protein
MTSKDLAEIVTREFRINPQIVNNEMLFTLALTKGRSQCVLISLIEKFAFQVILVKSRCCLATNASMVRSILSRNLKTPLGGFSLDTSTSPNAIDFNQKIFIPRDSELNISEFISTISKVASHADQIEQKLNQEDTF